eukprot:TRINITY_DN38899_c0_g1_i1.p1 TRINITY_DN38899_c0_g1~~TRINITY_DN38899_c0_g1_i1.p1  ORF type:complete len:147 (+),score=12.75 TRINITY_DN38899_c0_g1_i1:35-475(+)
MPSLRLFVPLLSSAKSSLVRVSPILAGQSGRCRAFSTMFSVDHNQDDAWVPRPALPPVKRDEVKIQVVASAVNRADLLQRKGLYNPPPGSSDILGLECTGRIVEVGDDVASQWSVGDEVCALLAGTYPEHPPSPSACFHLSCLSLS